MPVEAVRCCTAGIEMPSSALCKMTTGESPAEILAEAYPVINRQQLSPEQVPMRGTPKNENGRILRLRLNEGQGKSGRLPKICAFATMPCRRLVAAVQQRIVGGAACFI